MTAFSKSPSLRFLCNMIPTRDHIHKLLPFFEPASFNQADLARNLKGRHFGFQPQHLLVKVISKGIEVKKWALQLKQKDQK